MTTRTTYHAEMIAAHLNAPYGPWATVEGVRAVLRHGADALRMHPAEAGVLGWLFDECRPSLVLKACAEIGLDRAAALAAYRSLLAAGANRVSGWDELASLELEGDA